MQHLVELVGLTVLAMIAAATALMHGDVLFGVVFGGAAGFAGAQLIRRAVDL
jgi:hypothetical protein